MYTSDKLKEIFGDPLKDRADFERKYMTLWTYPADIAEAIPCLGTALYCNKGIVEPLERTYRDLIAKGLHTEIYSNDQCFCIRAIRGVPGRLSTHSWGMAIDLNPADNPLGLSRAEAEKKGLTPFTEPFIQVWRNNGWLCGADFTRKDLMHFEYTLHL